MRAFIVAASVALAAAHMCLLSPLQRGGVAGANETAANVCFSIQGPCGTSVSGAPVAAYLAGEVTSIAVLKNLDHFNPKSPGAFSAFLWSAAGNATSLGGVLDTAAPSETVYTIPVTIPSGTPSGSYIIQTVYTTDNSAAPSAFYQCADVIVL